MCFVYHRPFFYFRSPLSQLSRGMAREPDDETEQNQLCIGSGHKRQVRGKGMGCVVSIAPTPNVCVVSAVC